MRNVNKVFLRGNVTADPEVKYTRGGTAVINFSLATNESYKDSDGEWVEKAQFHNITAWGNQAELIGKMVRTGTQMHVEGSLNYGSYENDEGVTIRTTEVKLREFVLTSRAVDRSNDEEEQDQAVEPDVDEDAVDEEPIADDEEDDDLPF